MKTVCLFEVTEITRRKWGGDHVKFEARYEDGSDRDQSFAEATPTGGMEINVTNPNVVGVFEPGMKVYVHIEPVDQSA